MKLMKPKISSNQKDQSNKRNSDNKLILPTKILVRLLEDRLRKNVKISFVALRPIEKIFSQLKAIFNFEYFYF